MSLPEHLSDRAMAMAMAVAMLLVIYFCIISKISNKNEEGYSRKVFVAVQPNIITSHRYWLFEQSCCCCSPSVFSFAWPGHSYRYDLSYILRFSLYLVWAHSSIWAQCACVFVCEYKIYCGCNSVWVSFHYFRWCCCYCGSKNTYLKPKVSMLSIFHYFILMVISPRGKRCQRQRYSWYIMKDNDRDKGSYAFSMHELCSLAKAIIHI